MCGIAGIHRKNGTRIPRVNRLADELMLAIENRGRHGAGFLALMENGKVQLEKKACPASRFVKTRGKVNLNAKTVLLHTRWATVGAKDDPRNAHPVASGHTAAIHNGTIYNATELFTVFGLNRQAEVDSEIIPAMIDHAGWAEAATAIDLFDGGMATAVINTETPSEMILARTTGYPLVVMETEDLLVFASTRTAIEMAWRRTFNGQAPTGKFYEIGEWKMARINGTVEHFTIREYTPPKPRKVYGKVSTGKPVSRRARKRARKQYRTVQHDGRQTVMKIPSADGVHRASPSHTLVRQPTETKSQFAARCARADQWADTQAWAEELEADAVAAVNTTAAEPYIAQAVADLISEGFTVEEAWDMVDAPPSWDTADDEEFYSSKQLLM